MTTKIQKTIFLVRIEVLTQVTIKSVILWDVTPYIVSDELPASITRLHAVRSQKTALFDIFCSLYQLYKQ